MLNLACRWRIVVSRRDGGIWACGGGIGAVAVEYGAWLACEVERSGGSKDTVGLILLDASVIVSLPLSPISRSFIACISPVLACLSGLSLTHDLTTMSPLHTFLLSHFRGFLITGAPSALSWGVFRPSMTSSAEIDVSPLAGGPIGVG